MARAVVSSSVGPLGPLLEKLNALHAGEYGRMRGVRTLIGSLRSELTNMYAAVKDYDPAMLEEQAVEVKTWISLLRELAYDTEYCIDKFIHQLGSGGRHGGFKEFFRKAARNLKTLLSLRGIADQIDQLKVRIKQVKDLKNSSKLDDTLCSTNIHTAVDPRLRDFFAEDAHLVGMGGPRNDIIRLMMEASDSSQGTRVLSIVGFGGLGKTALANQVYRKIKSQYDFCAFVSVSQKPDVKSIIKDVMYKLGYIEDTDIWDEMRYIEELRELLKDKRYLIIIDDLWSTEAWNVIKHAFPWNKLSSRIITTTRIVDVAQSCCSSTNDCIYGMEPLAVDDARKLFMKRIFGYEDWCLNELQEVSHEILKKCGGLPLAIISISGLLANKPFVKDEWEKVKRSIGQLGRKQSLDQMNNIISLSYDELPPNLKTCLLYLSIFPEGFVIERERLVRLWIAERFIPEEHGRSQQEVAENYFYELINKNTVQPVDIGYDGKARACRVHHMMLALIYSKSVEDNFITMVGVGRTGLPNRHCLIRRLAVQRTDQELVSALESEDLSHVRSLIVTSSVCIEQLPSLDKFEALRVLDFEDCKGLEDHIINNLGKLFKLKYLNLSGTGISKLPLEIVLLHDLEVLDLRGTRIKELPAEIIQLTKIQHLLISSETWTQKGEIKIPDGIGNMVDLCVMSGFNVTESSADAVGELGHLITLRELHIKLNHGGSEQYKKQEEMLLSSLCKLGKLKSLRIHKCHGSLEFLDSWSPLPSSLETFRLSGDFCFMNIPKWISPELTNLAYLEISLTELRGNDLHTLGELPTLHYLYLSFVADPVKLITVQGTTGFKCLERFAIYSVAGSYITFSEGAMPKLEKLNVRLHVALAKNCGFYLGIQHLPCLKEAVVSFYEVAVAPFKIKAAAAAIRKEARVHPNHPTIDISGQFSENHSEISSDEEDLR